MKHSMIGCFEASLRLHDVPVMTSGIGGPLLSGNESRPILVAVKFADETTSSFSIVRFRAALSSKTLQFEDLFSSKKTFFTLPQGDKREDAQTRYVSLGNTGLSIKLYPTTPRRFLKLSDGLIFNFKIDAIFNYITLL